MENATKALIIAAAVLISIVIVALGVLLISNVSDSSGEAQKVGNSLSIAIGNAAGGFLGGKTISKEEAETFFKDKKIEYIIDGKKLSNKIHIKGYSYLKMNSDFMATEPNDSRINEWIIDQNAEGNVKLIDNPIDDYSKLPQIMKDVYKKMNNLTEEEFNEVKNTITFTTKWYFGNNELGEVNDLIYVVVLKYK